jgi:gamma-glutamyl-gamma-aminobutyraldehyde dehydrogenase
MTAIIEHPQALIAGQWTSDTGGRELVSINPADGSVIARIPACDAAAVDRAAVAADEVHRSGVWSERAPRDRAAVLLRLADLMERDAELLASLDSREAGKPISECRDNDVPGAIESIRWFAEAADKIYSDVSPTGPGQVGFTVREPVGVVAAILPWNYPLAMAAWKVGPALASGNCLLLKPADATPLSALHVARLADEAGLPPGVLSVLPGTGPVAGAALSAHPLIGALSFTGSTTTGRAILTAAAASNFKRISLEMGGKSPQILFADALSYGDALIDSVLESAFLTMGENCSAGSRILVHQSIAGEITERIAAAAAALVIGDPADPATQIGPLISRAALDRVHAMVDRAKQAGAEVHTGGAPVLGDSGGFYYPPTVITGAKASSEIQRAEIFGPVVTISTFTDETDAIAQANGTDYGLAASVWTKDLDRAHRMARAVRAGTVSVNCYSEGDMTVPFGGYRQSGFGGKEKSLAAFDQWTQTKTVWIQLR